MIIIRWQRYGLFVKQPRKWKYLFSVTTVLVSRWWQVAEPEHFCYILESFYNACRACITAGPTYINQNQNAL